VLVVVLVPAAYPLDSWWIGSLLVPMVVHRLGPLSTLFLRLPSCA